MANYDANQKHPFMLVIHTNLYSGNFEREMCAYVTGAIGECRVGAEMRDILLQELVELGTTKEDAKKQMKSWADLTSQQQDEFRCKRPCAIYPTPGRYNNGRGQHFDDDQFDPKKTWKGIKWPAYESVAIYFKKPITPEQQALFSLRARDFADKLYNIQSSRLNFGKTPEVPMIITGINYIERNTTTDASNVSL